MINLWYVINFLQCGHFCVKYVLKKNGENKSLVYEKNMMSLGLIRRILKEYYKECECYLVGDLNDIKDEKNVITLIKVRNKFLHYIVILNVNERNVFFYDPLFLNKRKMKVEKFEKKWSKYCCIYK